MSDIEALCKHRTELLAMKSGILANRKDNAVIHASCLDKDIQRVDMLIELVLKTPQQPADKGDE